MYTEFFGLKTKPFELVPNPDFLFLSKSHRRAVTYLDYGIKEKSGFILLTGEVGSGKTTLLRNFIKGMRGKKRLSKIFNTKVSSEQLISMINEDFGLEVQGKDKVTLLRELNDFLIEQYAKGYHPVLVIDEAQGLSPELLEEVRMLSNLETDKSKLLQIILIGQPELRRTLAMPELRQLRQRINISCHLSPLTRGETEEYILHRLEIAGNRTAAVFSPEVLDVVQEFSRGIPRLINIICDFLMLSAHAEGTRELTPELAAEIVGELELANKYWSDELPVLRQSGNGKHMKEMAERLAKLEEMALKEQPSNGEVSELSERMYESEERMQGMLASSRDEVAMLARRLSDIQREVISLRSMSSEIQKRLLSLRNPKRGFLDKLLR